MRRAISAFLKLTYRGPLIAVGLVISLAGCAAPLQAGLLAPGSPIISNLEFSPERVTAGCSVMIRFRFQDPEGDIVMARAYWSLDQHNKRVASTRLTLPIELSVFAGKITGEAAARLTPDRYGTYWYYVQVEDAAGHKSNVLREPILVDAPWPWQKKSRACK